MKLNKKCNKCGNDDWTMVDSQKKHIEICKVCCNIVSIPKQDYLNMFLSEFTCEKCGCNKGRINDGNEIITIRCSSCKQINIVFDKTVSATQNKQNVKSFVPKCPICSSPNIHKISIPKRAVRGAMFGLFSKTARSQWECKNCGNKW